MQVRLFRLGGHDYIFRFGIFREGKPKAAKKPLKNVKYKKVCLTHNIPQNKYGYSKANISKNFGLKKYAMVMDRMAEILSCIPTDFVATIDVLKEIKKRLPKDIDITTANLNLIARIHESTPLRDKEGKLWQLLIKNWGVASQIKKEEVKR